MNNRNKLLSNTEIRIIRLIIQGNCNKDIAKELFLSESSIKKYISMINYNLNNITRKIEAVDLMRYKLLYSPSNIKIHRFIVFPVNAVVWNIMINRLPYLISPAYNHKYPTNTLTRHDLLDIICLGGVI